MAIWECETISQSGFQKKIKYLRFLNFSIDEQIQYILHILSVHNEGVQLSWKNQDLLKGIRVRIIARYE